MPEIKVLVEFPECPDCGSTKTVAKEGYAELEEKGKLQKGIFLSLTKQLFPPPLSQSTAFASITTEALLVHTDVCFECGRQRCTRVEVVPAQIQVQPGPMPNFPYRGDGGGGLPKFPFNKG